MASGVVEPGAHVVLPCAGLATLLDLCAPDEFAASYQGTLYSPTAVAEAVVKVLELKAADGCERGVWRSPAVLVHYRAAV
jgi:hypothetical protein